MELEKQYGLDVYPKRDLTLVRGEGALVWDNEGNEYIDCAAGIGVANVGHANPVVAAAVAEQSRTLVTCPGIFYNDRRGELMQALVRLSPPGLDRVFLCNSGTEAMEAALKFARLSTGRKGVISAMRGFHGRTMGSLSATFKYRDEFEPAIPNHRFVPYNNLDKLAAALDDDVAAIVLEIVQGEGGVRPADPDYLKGVRKLCDEYQTLLIVDEVQTGFARTGRMFACEHAGISPDIMTLAKAMAGGVPMGAVLCNERVHSIQGKHGSTFGGNPLACAAALATLGFLENNDLVSASRARGDQFRLAFEANMPAPVRELRQLGLMIGIELKIKSRPVIEALLDRRVLAIPAGPTVVRLLPPLVISEQQINIVVERTVDAIESCG